MELPLRQRKKIRTMVHIQAVAMRLFEARGYREVTIEQIAHEAEVAPATVYRYFETKTGFFTLDPVEHPVYDDPEFARNLLADPVNAVQSLFAQIIADGDTEPIFLAGMQYVIDIPEVRAAVLLKNVQLADELAMNLVIEMNLAEIAAKSFTRSLLIGVFTAMEQWHIDGRGANFGSYLAKTCGGIQPPTA